MLLIDDLLLAPVQGLLWFARKIDEAVSQELEKEEEAIKARLKELYLQLEAGQLDEQAFEAQEAVLLDRLDAIAASREEGSIEEEEGEEHERG
jgi:urocanate hydratase